MAAPIHPRPNPVEARVSLIGREDSVSEGTAEYHSAETLREALYEAAKIVKAQVEAVPHDVGRLIAALDAIKHAKDLALDSMALYRGEEHYPERKVGSKSSHPAPSEGTLDEYKQVRKLYPQIFPDGSK